MEEKKRYCKGCKTDKKESYFSQDIEYSYCLVCVERMLLEKEWKCARPGRKTCPNCGDTHEESYFRNRHGEPRKWCLYCCEEGRKHAEENRSPPGQGKRNKKKRLAAKKQLKKEARNWNRSPQTLSENRTLSFGKYKGWHVQNLPQDYLEWFIVQDTVPESIRKEYNRRKRTSKT